MQDQSIAWFDEMIIVNGLRDVSIIGDILTIRDEESCRFFEKAYHDLCDSIIEGLEEKTLGVFECMYKVVNASYYTIGKFNDCRMRTNLPITQLSIWHMFNAEDNSFSFNVVLLD